MDDRDDINEILNIVDVYNDYKPRRQFWKRNRLNPIVYIKSEELFKLTYQFNKENVKKIA